MANKGILTGSKIPETNRISSRVRARETKRSKYPDMGDYSTSNYILGMELNSPLVSIFPFAEPKIILDKRKSYTYDEALSHVNHFCGLISLNFPKNNSTTSLKVGSGLPVIPSNKSESISQAVKRFKKKFEGEVNLNKKYTCSNIFEMIRATVDQEFVNETGSISLDCTNNFDETVTITASYLPKVIHTLRPEMGSNVQSTLRMYKQVKQMYVRELGRTAFKDF